MLHCLIVLHVYRLGKKSKVPVDVGEDEADMSSTQDVEHVHSDSKANNDQRFNGTVSYNNEAFSSQL